MIEGLQGSRPTDCPTDDLFSPESLERLGMKIKEDPTTRLELERLANPTRVTAPLSERPDNERAEIEKQGARLKEQLVTSRRTKKPSKGKK